MICNGIEMRSATGEAPTLNHMSSTFPDLDSLNAREEVQSSHSGSAKNGLSPSDAAEHRERLERRLQAQLRDGSRSKNVKRLEDPIAKHLIRVAGNPAYRSVAHGRQSAFYVLVFLQITHPLVIVVCIDSSTD